ncbi:hypothetical protein ACFQ38_07870 [Sporosarcina contaminans]|uniref:Uncharacterized protein n=1 Tax=Sporosarcina contaminans TaxID=633403 RepID=A0ABW3TXG7_9BACL
MSKFFSIITASILGVILILMPFETISNATSLGNDVVLDRNEAFVDPASGDLIIPLKLTDSGFVVMSQEEYLAERDNQPREEVVEDIETTSEIKPMDYREYWRYSPSSKSVVTGARKKVSADINCTTVTCSVGKGINTTVSHSFNVTATAEKDAIKAGAGYTWVSSAGQVNTYAFNLKKGDKGYIAFDPKYNKTTGTLRKYSNWDGNTVLASKTGIGYSVKKVGSEADGTYLFVYTK